MGDNVISHVPFRLINLGIAIVLIVVLLPVTSANAATTIIVNSTANIVANDGLCTLREAITAANTDSAFNGCPAGSGGDTILLQAGATYILDGVDNYDYGPNGLPSVTTPITITGQGATIARDTGAPDFRLVYVGPAGNLTLVDLTLRNGRARGGAGGPSGNGSGGGAGLGGAIFNRGTLTLRGCTLTQNEAIGGAGGFGNNNDPITGGGSGGGGGGGLGGAGGHGHNYYPADVDYGGGGGGGMGGQWRRRR